MSWFYYLTIILCIYANCFILSVLEVGRRFIFTTTAFKGVIQVMLTIKFKTLIKYKN